MNCGPDVAVKTPMEGSGEEQYPGVPMAKVVPGRTSHVYMLDKDGNRIDQRNPQDITPLYNNQIPPGAATCSLQIHRARASGRTLDRR